MDPLYFSVKDAKLLSDFDHLNYTKDQVQGDARWTVQFALDQGSKVIYVFDDRW